MQIEDELFNTVNKYRKLAKLNYFIAFGLYLIAVIASILSTLMALMGTLSGPELAAITAIPGAVLLVMGTFRFVERARWHFDKKNQLNALYRLARSKAPGTSPAEIAEKWNQIDLHMEKSWPSFGVLTLESSNQDNKPHS